MVIYLSFHNSSFALKILFNVNGKAIVWCHTPCLMVFARVEEEFEKEKKAGFKVPGCVSLSICH
jgi:hypothetical protein